jgi:hypothetical protein
MDPREIDIAQKWQFICAAVLLKFIVRLVCWRGSSSPDQTELNKRLFFLAEHTVFSVVAYYVIVYLPGNLSWYHHPELCWPYPPTCPSNSFDMFYIAKIGTHIEDVLFRVGESIYQKKQWRHAMEASKDSSKESSSISATGSANSVQKKPDVMMDLHHVVTAALCILSYCSGSVYTSTILFEPNLCIPTCVDTLG